MDKTRWTILCTHIIALCWEKLQDLSALGDKTTRGRIVKWKAVQASDRTWVEVEMQGATCSATIGSATQPGPATCNCCYPQLLHLTSHCAHPRLLAHPRRRCQQVREIEMWPFFSARRDCVSLLSSRKTLLTGGLGSLLGAGLSRLPIDGQLLPAPGHGKPRGPEQEEDQQHHHHPPCFTNIMLQVELVTSMVRV